MRTLLLSLVAGLGIVAAGCKSTGGCCAEEGVTSGSGAGAYRHVVLFKFKETATPMEVSQVEQAFGKLPSQIDSITDYEWGTNVSPEGKADGFTHCFFVSFKDKAGLEKYLPHPAHQAFVKVLRPHLDKVLVVDYVAKK